MEFFEAGFADRLVFEFPHEKSGGNKRTQIIDNLVWENETPFLNLYIVEKVVGEIISLIFGSR